MSRVFGLIERFSEDVDILVVFPHNTSNGARDKALKAMVENVRLHLGLETSACRAAGSTTGVKRNNRYLYPREFASPAAEDGVLLEMGSRGGDQPHVRRVVRSMVASYAQDVLEESVDTWAEWAPVTVDVLAPERTLLEKIAALHDLASRAAEDEASALQLARASRHYYDVHRLLIDPDVCAALSALTSNGVAALAADVDEHTAAAGWTHTPRPVAGYGTSVAFDSDGPHVAAVAIAYEKAMKMVYGSAPTWLECAATVRRHSGLL